MNQELATVIKRYATEKHKNLNTYLIGKSKDTLIATLMDLLTMYINDKNSSTIREFVTVSLSGYTHKEGKIGYNGYKQNSIIKGKWRRAILKYETGKKSLSRPIMSYYEEIVYLTKIVKSKFFNILPIKLKRLIRD